MPNEDYLSYVDALEAMGVKTARQVFPAFNLAYSTEKLPSTSPSGFGKGKRSAGAEKVREQILNVFNSSSDPFSSLQYSGHGIWKEVYGHTRYKTLHQQAIEQALNFPKQGTFYGLDIESVGEVLDNSYDPSLQYFGVTEMAMHRYYYNGNGKDGLVRQPRAMEVGVSQSKSGTKKLYNWMDSALGDGKLYDFQRRSIVDLAKYDPLKGAILTVEGNVQQHADAVWINTLKNHQGKFTSEQVASMRRGLENLNSNGLKFRDAMEKYSRRVANANAKGIPFLTWNGIEFDLNRLQYAVDQANTTMQRGKVKFDMPTNHLDFLQVLRTSPNIYETLYGGSRTPLPDEPYSRRLGEMQLEHVMKYLGIGTGSQHRAGFDVFGMSQAVVDILDGRTGLRQSLAAAGNLSTADPTRIDSGLRYNPAELRAGQTMLSIAGRFAQGESDEDMTLRLIDGKYQMVKYPDMSVRGRRFYRFRGYQQLGTGKDSRHLAVFENLSSDGGHQEFQVITRASKGELAESIHEVLKPWNPRKREEQLTVLASDYDSAARRWRRMFAPEKGGGYASLKRALSYLDVTRSGDQGKIDLFNSALTPEMLRDFSIFTNPQGLGAGMPGGRLLAEERIWRKVAGYIGGLHLQNGLQRDLALQVAKQEVDKQFNFGNHVTRRPRTILERYELPVLDPTTKEVHRINFSDPARANESIWNMLYGRARGRSASERSASLEAEFEKFVRSLTVPHVAERATDVGIEKWSVDRILSNEEANTFLKGETLSNKINSLTSHIISRRHGRMAGMAKENIYVESLGARSIDIANMAQDQFESMMSKVFASVNRQLNVIKDLHNDQFSRWITDYQDKVARSGNLIGSVDISSALTQIKSKYGQYFNITFGYMGGQDEPYAIKMLLSGKDRDSRARASVYMMDAEAQMRGMLPRGMAEVIMPLPDSQGVMQLGRRKILGQSMLSLNRSGDNFSFRAVTPFEQQIEALTDRWTVQRFSDYVFRENDWDSANWELKRTVANSLQRMSSPSRTFGIDTELDLNVRQGMSDQLRRGFVHTQDLAYYAAYRLGKKNVNVDLNPDKWDQTWKNMDFVDRLNVIRAIPQMWKDEIAPALESAGVHGVTKNTPLTSFGVRGSQLSNSIFSIEDVRKYYPGMYYDKPGRENPLQFMNYHNLDTAAGYADGRFAGMLTATKDQMKAMNKINKNGVAGIYGTGLFMDETQINNLMDNYGKEFNFLSRPTTYEQQMWIADDYAKQFRATVEKSYIVDSLAQSDVYVGGELKQGQVLGKTGRGNIVFDAKGEGAKITDIVDLGNGKMQVVTNVTKTLEQGDKLVMGGGEKVTVNVGQRAQFDKMFGGGVDYLTHMNMLRHQDYGSYIHSQIATGALAVQAGKLDKDAFLESLRSDLGIGSADYSGSTLVLPPNMGTVTADKLEAYRNKVGRDLFFRNVNGMEIETRTDELRFANVNDVLGASQRFEGDALANKRARLGRRELNAIYEKYWEDSAGRHNLLQTKAWLNAEGTMWHSKNIVQEAKDIRSVFGAFMGYGTDGVESKTINDFKAVGPGGLYSKGQLKDTMFDMDKNGMFSLTLPEEVEINLGGKYNQDLVKTNKLYMAYTSPGAMPSGEYTLSNLQRAQRAVYSAAERLNDLHHNANKVVKEGNGNLYEELKRDLQFAANNYIDELTSVTDSRGFLDENLIKTDISSSGYGRVHILSPENLSHLDKLDTSDSWKNMLQNENVVIMSRKRASAMGLSDDMLEQMADPTKGVFGLSQRYPNINPDTIDVTRFFVHDDLQNDTLYMTAGQAKRYHADSDGDFLAMFFANGKHIKNQAGIRSEMEAYWQYQNANGRWKKNRDAAEQGYLSMINEQKSMSHVMSRLDNGIAQRIGESDSIADMETKLGKMFIGYISNSQQRAGDYARMLEYKGKLTSDQVRNIQTFGETLEQKAIDIKRGLTDNLEYVGYSLSAEPQNAIALSRHLRRASRPGTEAEFMNDFGEIFKGQEDVVHDFFEMARMDGGKWNQMQEDIFWSGSTGDKGGIAGVWRWMNMEGMPTPNSKLLAEAMGEEGKFNELLDKLYVNSNVTYNAMELEKMSGLTSGIRDQVVSNVADMIKKDGGDMLKVGGLGVGALALAGMALRIGHRDTDVNPESIAVQAPPPDATPATPQARVTPNQGFNVRVRAVDSTGQDISQIASNMNGQLGNSVGPVNSNIHVKDDSRKMNDQWLQELFANALNTGVAY